ncbi:MAG: flagellar hook-basal body complex protein [Christensenellales bacterium]
MDNGVCSKDGAADEYFCSRHIVGIDRTSGDRVIIGQIATAGFANQAGLEKAGQSAYIAAPNSGEPVYRAAGSQGAGALVTGALEMSNVDLANEFSDMIVTQRGFQANSRIITTTDQMIEEIVNLKR